MSARSQFGSTKRSYGRKCSECSATHSEHAEHLSIQGVFRVFRTPSKTSGGTPAKHRALRLGLRALNALGLQVPKNRGSGFDFRSNMA